MVKRVESFLNDLLKFKLNIKMMNIINLYSIILLFISLIIPNLIYEVLRISITTLSYKIIYLIFIIPLAYVFIYNVIRNKVKGWDVRFLTFFVIFVLISSVLSKNPFVAILGGVRKDGFITLLLYYLVYTNSKTLPKKSIHVLIKSILIVGYFNVLYGFIQSYLPRFFLSTKTFNHMAYGLMGNPNFYGTYMLMLTILSLLLYLFKEHRKLYLFSSIIFYISLVLSSSSSTFITLIFMLFIILIYVLKKGINVYRYFKVIMIFILCYFIFNYSNTYINNTLYKVNINKEATIAGTFNDIKYGLTNNSLLNDLDVISSGRISLWYDTINYIKKNKVLLFGVGADNFSIYHLTIKDNKIVDMYHHDKAHNVYLNILVENGIFSLIMFILWIFSYHKKIIKGKNVLSYILLFVLIGYNIQGLFNINVIYVMIYYYLFAGIAIGQGEFE